MSSVYLTDCQYARLVAMKLVSLNVEGNAHFGSVHAFLRDEKPDCFCLQEAPGYFTETLRALGYITAYAPMRIETQNGETYENGIIIGSKLPMVTREHYYFGTRDVITVHKPDVDETSIQVSPYLIASVTDSDGVEYNIATTHLMVTKDGLADEHQKEGAAALLTLLKDESPHLICGDFNMPRGYNELYEKFTERYTDSIPKSYTSSLDRDLHRCGKLTNLNAPIFDIYMVDYIFTQPPFVASHVRLQFGISDHAAVIADIPRTET